jgi:hypothetical protein
MRRSRGAVNRWSDEIGNGWQARNGMSTAGRAQPLHRKKILMRKLLTLWIALGALALLFHATLGYSQGLMTLGAGSVKGVVGGGSPPSYTLVGSLNNASSLTLSGPLNLGASTSQLIVLALANTFGGTWSAVTVGGTSLTQVLNPGDGTALFAGVVALTGSQTVSAVGSTGQFSNKMLTVWALNNLSSTTVQHTATWTTGNSTISVTAGDLMFASDANNSLNCSWGGSTQAPNATQAPITLVQTADWTISATNASFTINPSCPGGGQTGNSVATWH